MGNYIFNTQTLVEMVTEDARRNSEHDFGRTVIGQALERYKVFAYNFLNNDVPGVKPYEEQGLLARCRQFLLVLVRPYGSSRGHPGIRSQ